MDAKQIAAAARRVAERFENVANDPELADNPLGRGLAKTTQRAFEQFADEIESAVQD